MITDYNNPYTFVNPNDSGSYAAFHLGVIVGGGGGISPTDSYRPGVIDNLISQRQMAQFGRTSAQLDSANNPRNFFTGNGVVNVSDWGQQGPQTMASWLKGLSSGYDTASGSTNFSIPDNLLPSGWGTSTNTSVSKPYFGTEVGSPYGVQNPLGYENGGISNINTVVRATGNSPVYTQLSRSQGSPYGNSFQQTDPGSGPSFQDIFQPFSGFTNAAPFVNVAGQPNRQVGYLAGGDPNSLAVAGGRFDNGFNGPFLTSQFNLVGQTFAASPPFNPFAAGTPEAGLSGAAFFQAELNSFTNNDINGITPGTQTVFDMPGLFNFGSFSLSGVKR